MKFRAQIQNGSITFADEDRFSTWAGKNSGTRLLITDDEPITGELRRFFEGAIVPFFGLTNKINGKAIPLDEAREILKAEFNAKYIRGLKGGMVVGGSTAKLNKEQFREFVEKILRWFEQNGYEVPDSVDYRKWVDSGPLVGDVYPPIKRLMETQ